MTTYNAILEISDGTTTVDLLPWLKDWTPQVPGLKDGGVFESGPFTDGRRLVLAKFDNAVETFYLVPNGFVQDDIIHKLQTLRKLLQKGREFWTTSWQNDPVWIKARGSQETNSRYAVLVDWSTPQDDNPFAQPFYSFPGVAMIDFALIIEHGVWQDSIPGSATCIQIDNIDSEPVTVTNITPAPAANSDDVYFTLPGYTLTGGSALRAGNVSDTYNGALIRFTNVTVPAGAHIGEAYISFYAASSQSGTTCDLRIYMQDVGDAATWSTYSDLASRSWLNDTVAWPEVEVMTIGNNYITPRITGLVQQVVDRSDWASGNDMAVFIRDDPFNISSLNAYREIASFDNVTYTEPQLVIYYTGSSDSTDFGRIATCDNEVYVGNCHPHNQISEVWFYDASLTSFTQHTLGSGFPFDLTTTIPAAGDAIYFGISSSLANAGPFSGLVFDLSQEMSGVTDAEWQYYDGSWLELITVSDNTGDPYPLQKTGVNSVHWQQPGTWIENSDVGTTGWFVRVLINSVSGAQKAIQQNREIYIPNMPYIDISSSTVSGDLPALSRILLYPQSAQSEGYLINWLHLRDVIIGLRSTSRGSDFTPYINMSENHNPHGITVADYYSTGAITANSLSPSGYSMNWTPSGVVSDIRLCSINFGAEISPQYTGQFRMFLRGMQMAGSAGDITIKVQAANYSYSSGYFITSQYKPFVSITPYLDVLDLGLITIEDTANLVIYLYGSNSNAANPGIRIYDFILFPVDEWSGEFWHNSLNFCTSQYLDIDSATNSSKLVSVNAKSVSDDSVVTPLSQITAGEIVLQVDEDQKLWFFALAGPQMDESKNPNVGISYKVQVQAVKRYFSMRGAN